MQQARVQSQPTGEAHRDLTIPQAMQHAGIKSRSTFDKYVLSLNITIKKPGIVSKRHYITWRDAELLRQLRENPSRLEELRYPRDAEKDPNSDA